MRTSHIRCDDCGSSDALTVYPSGFSKCYSCGKYKRYNTNNNNKENKLIQPEIKKEEKVSNLIPLGSNYQAFRGVSQKTFEKYKVWTQGNDQFYPLFDKNNVHVANQIRQTNVKGFLVNGDYSKKGVFGRNLFPPNSFKQITITEGHLDALSAYEMQGSQYPVVSVSSASSAEKEVADDFEYLNSFNEIVICFDRDEPHKKPNGEVWFPGQEAALRVAAMFHLGKVRILTLADAKDANDYIQKGWGAKFVKEWWKAPIWTPAGLKLGKDLWDEVLAQKNYETIPYPWEGLNQFTFGLRLSELVTVTADSGIGKTAVVKEIEHYLLKNTNRGIGILHLEEPNGDTLLGLMSITANKPLHIPDVRKDVGEEELRRYYDETCNTERIVIWDHFGSNSIDSVLNTIRHMNNLGCKYIILDHLSIVVSDQNGDERKQLDEISTKIKTLCMELNIAVIAIIHQNRNGQIRGTAGVEQLSNMVFKLSRDKEDADEWRRNVTKITVQKNRFCGKTGPAAYLYYDGETGRLVELTKDQIIKYEAGLGDNLKGNEW